MARFGVIPPEPPRLTDLAPLPDKFERQVRATLADLSSHNQPSFVREAMRTAERQAWLWGFGRLYDDGRGRVTNAKAPWQTWHPYGLAVDIVPVGLEDNAPPTYWRLLQGIAEANGLQSGMSWPTMHDGPHVQFGTLKRSPSATARALYLSGGLPAVWRAAGAL